MDSLEEDWAALNTDGVIFETNIVDHGGLIRNHNGQWIVGYSKYLGICNTLKPKMWSVWEGILVANAKALIKLRFKWTNSEVYKLL